MRTRAGGQPPPPPPEAQSASFTVVSVGESACRSSSPTASGLLSVKPRPSSNELYAPYAPSPALFTALTLTLYCVAFAMPQNSAVVMAFDSTVIGEPLVPPRSISVSPPVSSCLIMPSL